jgi:hypothetical protein
MSLHLMGLSKALYRSHPWCTLNLSSTKVSIFSLEHDKILLIKAILTSNPLTVQDKWSGCVMHEKSPAIGIENDGSWLVRIANY